MKIIFTKKFFKYFLIGFSIFMGIGLLSFLIRHSAEIFTNWFSIGRILKLIYYNSLTGLTFSLIFGLLIASIFAFKFYSMKQVVDFRKELLIGALIVIGISLLLFGFNNWVLPKSSHELLPFFYDMKFTTSREEMNRSDIYLFKDNQYMMSIKKINHNIDTFNIQIDNHRNLCDSVLATLPDAIAKEEFDRLRFEEFGIIYKSTAKDTLCEKETRIAVIYLRLCHSNLKWFIEQKERFNKEKTTRIILPIELLLLYIIGASFGFIYNDQKTLLLVILGLYTMNLFYGTIKGFEHLISLNIFGIAKSTITSLIILVFATSVFLIKALKKEQQITQPNKM